MTEEEKNLNKLFLRKMNESEEDSYTPADDIFSGILYEFFESIRTSCESWNDDTYKRIALLELFSRVSDMVSIRMNFAMQSFCSKNISTSCENERHQSLNGVVIMSNLTEKLSSFDKQIANMFSIECSNLVSTFSCIEQLKNSHKYVCDIDLYVDRMLKILEEERCCKRIYYDSDYYECVEYIPKYVNLLLDIATAPEVFFRVYNSSYKTAQIKEIYEKFRVCFLEAEQFLSDFIEDYQLVSHYTKKEE